jgi:hypothetical protein
MDSWSVSSIFLFKLTSCQTDLHHMQIELYTSLDNLITSFKSFVLSLPNDGSHRTRMLLIHSLLNGAITRLHLPFAAGAEASSAKCTSAAREVVELASELMNYDQGGGWCHPTFGVRIVSVLGLHSGCSNTRLTKK